MRDPQENNIIDPTWGKYIPHARKLLEHYVVANRMIRTEIRRYVGDAASCLGLPDSRSRIVNAIDRYDTATKGATYGVSEKDAQIINVSVLHLASIFADMDDAGYSFEDYLKSQGQDGN